MISVKFNNGFNSVLMFNVLFLKQLKYFKILKKGPFIWIISLQRIVSVILALKSAEIQLCVVPDKKQGGTKNILL